MLLLIASIIFGWLLSGYLAFRVQLALTGGIKEKETYTYKKVLSQYGKDYQKRYGRVTSNRMYWDDERTVVPAVHYNPRDGLKWMLYGTPMFVYQVIILVANGVEKSYNATKSAFNAVAEAVYRFLTSDGFNTSPVVNKFFGLK